MTLFDPGLQPERTQLAWRRTALALGASTLVGARLLGGVLGDASWIVPIVLGLAVTAALFAAIEVRARRIDAALGAPAPVLPGAGLFWAAAAGVFAIGIAALIVVVGIALGR